MATTSQGIQKMMLLGLVISSGLILSACQARYDASQNLSVPVEESTSNDTMVESDSQVSGQQPRNSDTAAGSPSPEQKKVVELESQVELIEFQEEDFSDL